MTADERSRTVPSYPTGSHRVRVVRREEWGAVPSEGWPVEVADTRAVVVHHTGRDGIGDLQRLLHVQRFHAVTRGWGDIGYSYLVLPDGRVAEGREGTVDAGPGRAAVGGHALGRNVGTVGVAVVGRYDDDRPTAAAWESLVALVTDLCEGAGLDPLGGEVTLVDGRTVPAVISGHRDVRDTPCPGEALAAALPELRREVVARLARSAP